MKSCNRNLSLKERCDVQHPLYEILFEKENKMTVQTVTIKNVTLIYSGNPMRLLQQTKGLDFA